ncbi:MlaA family lipoprotein [Novosphingobium rosa]|uniref:MlaA family lipoprotein n=1 Tax=Novosphingobium rosa TaxID=76978 RepID=UPI000834171F|nr:VacJ family lipoprotein [Novosphingobium rosa]
MIFTAPIAGLGLVLAPTGGVLAPTVDAPALTVIEPPVITAPAADTTPPASEATSPTADPAAAPQPDATAQVAAVKAEATNPAPLGTCHVCGPVYAARDPLIGMNRVFYAINQPIDRFIFRPPAMVYKAVIPRPAREGVRNALSNIYSPVTFLNDVVQLRPKHALTTLGRFVINSTLGIGGLFDIAKRKPFHMQGHTNSFSNSLAMLGMTSGPYLYLPFIGPSSFRDMLGAGGDTFAQPLLVNRVYSRQDRTVGPAMRPRKVSSFSSTLSLSTFGVVLATLSALDRRAEADAELKALKASAVDPYVALREAYLQNREAEIAALKAKDGQAAPVAAFDDPLADPAAQPAPAQPAPAPAK